MTYVLRHRLVFVAAAVCFSACGPAAEPPRGAEVPAAATPERLIIPEAATEPPPSAETLLALSAPAKGDLEAIAARGVVRILVAPSRTYYDVANNAQRGSTFDAGAVFERFLNARLPSRPTPVRVVLIPTPEDALVRDLLAGRGDIAANLRQTFERDDQVAFAAPTRTGIRELIVTGSGHPALVSLEDAGGRTIHVRKSSDHHASLVRLNEQLRKIARPPATIVFADDRMTAEDLVDRVNEGTFPATLVDDYLFEARRRELTNVASNKDVAVSQDIAIAWVTRKDSPQLLAAVNAFWASHKP